MGVSGAREVSGTMGVRSAGRVGVVGAVRERDFILSDKEEERRLKMFETIGRRVREECKVDCELLKTRGRRGARMGSYTAPHC